MDAFVHGAVVIGHLVSRICCRPMFMPLLCTRYLTAVRSIRRRRICYFNRSVVRLSVVLVGRSVPPVHLTDASVNAGYTAAVSPAAMAPAAADTGVCQQKVIPATGGSSCQLATRQRQLHPAWSGRLITVSVFPQCGCSLDVPSSTQRHAHY
jgi:hypothetical protein